MGGKAAQERRKAARLALKQSEDAISKPNITINKSKEGDRVKSINRTLMGRGKKVVKVSNIRSRIN